MGVSGFGGEDGGDDDQTDGRTDVQTDDVDGDGYPADKDCDDTDATVHPRAEETPYDGIDQDCNGEDVIDADGDGFIAVEADGDDCNDDQTYIHPGAEQRLTGFDTNCDGNLEIDLGRDPVAFVGETSGDEAGFATAMGDVNGDGYDDVVIGAPQHHINLDAGFEGKVYVFFGGEGRFSPGTTLNVSDADVQMNGACNWVLGKSLSVKDLDGDGKAELLIGAPGYNAITCEPPYVAGDSSRSGAILVFAGREEWESTYDFYEIDAWNNDELAERDIGLIRGRDREGALGGLGNNILVTGDIDGDGTGEIVAGRASRCEVIPAVMETGIRNIADISAVGGTHIYNAAGNPYAGNHCDNVASGDFDNDGLADLVLANTADEIHDGAGEVAVVFGGDTWPAPMNLALLSQYTGVRYRHFSGNGAGYAAGESLSTGDVDGDGKDDLAIGVFGEDDPFTDAGRVYIIPGDSMGEVVDTGMAGFSNGDNLVLNGDIYDIGGRSVYGDRDNAFLPTGGLSIAGDTNGDGLTVS